jgi:hypothetical protein
MQFMHAHLYTDLFVVCGADARCLVKNDSPLAGFAGTLVLTALDVATGATHALNSTTVALPAGKRDWITAACSLAFARSSSLASAPSAGAASPSAPLAPGFSALGGVDHALRIVDARRS